MIKIVLKFLNSYIYDENSIDTPLMILIYENLSHFNLIYPKIEKMDNNINLKIPKPVGDNSDFILNNINDEPFLKSDEIIEDKTSGNIDIDNLIENDENIFPKHTTDKDEKLYWHIFKFLRNGIQNRKRTWPDYIEMIGDKKVRDNKKTEFYRKMGLIKISKERLIIFS